MTQNPFQPWKQTLNLNTNFFRKNEEEFGQKVKNSDFNINHNNSESLGSQSCSNNLPAHSHSFELSNESQHNYPPAVSSTEEQLQQQQQKSSSNPKFSIFNQLNNLHKVNAFDNLLNATTNPDDDELSDDKKQGMRLLMEQAISDEAKQQIAFIMEKISMLRPAEKMLLYLKMPGAQSDSDPLKQSQNPLGSRSEISHTINWVRSHLEHDSNVSIPKQEVYEDYVTYCGKISIKPLSTADFGKVMKQVFPDIRPRRLGTRGHSRYCYAAMRKATKLRPPQLADISSKNATSCDGDKEEVAWNIVKSWSESLLNSQFQSVDELANHISTNHLNSPSNTTSKQLLQKKLLQREMKEKKRLSNQSKKKRKKRRKSLSTSSDAQQIQEMYDNHNREIKQEKETDGSAVENNDVLSENSSDVPMNLTNTEMSMNRINVISDASLTCHSTNESIATTFSDQLLMNGTTIPINSFDMPSQSSLDSISKHTTVRNKLKHKINSSIIEAESQQQPQPPPSPLGEDNQYILCKKVRQAHQAKNLMMSAMAASQFTEPPKTGPITNDPEIATQMLMPSKIPAKRKFRKEQGTSNGKKSKTDGTENTSSPLNHVEPSDLVVKNGDLKEDFILPRERFISICNMDKNALDTYLNLNEDSSQDPELLQYFGEDKSKKTETIDEGEDLGAPSTSIPLLENYQLFSDSNKSDREQRHSDKLSQLRSMLEEKYQQGGLGNDSVIKNLLLRNTQHAGNVSCSNDQLNMYHGSASNSLALMSQRHNNNMASVQAVNGNNLQGPRPFPIDCVPDTDTLVPQSPNSRRRILGFLPITHTAKGVKNINNNPLFKTDSTNASPFVSPRATPIPKRNTNKCLNLNQHLLNVQEPKMMIGTNNTAFSRPQQFKMEPVSAPPSPSMVQNFHFGNQSGNCFQFQNVNQQNSMYPVESRSQSVPPHCTNTNLYNNNTNYNTNYSSACSSVAPTPVPSEYADFSDNVILDIFNSGPQVKLEATEDSVISELLENEILNQNSDTNEADLMAMNDVTMRQNFASISRSVPNTPLPYHQGYNHNNNNNNNNCNNGNSNNNNNHMYSMGKSVPNTPIANNNCNPFRYSPELTRTRDFLINGFNNNINNNNNNNDNVINKMMKSHDVGTGSGVQLIEDLDSSILSGL